LCGDGIAACRLFNRFQAAKITATRHAGNAVATQVVKRLQASLQARFETLSLTGRLIGSSAFEVYEAKVLLLQAWVKSTWRCKRRCPQPARDAARKGLADAQAVIDDDNATVEQIGAQVTALAALRGKVDEAAATQIRARMSDLRKAIGADPNLLPLLPKIGDIETKLAVPGIPARWTPSSSCASTTQGKRRQPRRGHENETLRSGRRRMAGHRRRSREVSGGIPARTAKPPSPSFASHDRVPQAGGNCFRAAIDVKLQAKPGNVALTALQAD